MNTAYLSWDFSNTRNKSLSMKNFEGKDIDRMIIKISGFPEENQFLSMVECFKKLKKKGVVTSIFVAGDLDISVAALSDEADSLVIDKHSKLNKNSIFSDASIKKMVSKMLKSRSEKVKKFGLNPKCLYEDSQVDISNRLMSLMDSNEFSYLIFSPIEATIKFKSEPMMAMSSM